MLHLVVLFVSFVLASGLMALVEASVLSVTWAEVEVMVQRGARGATSLRTLKDHITRAVVAMVVVTNTINVLGPILVGTAAINLYGSAVIGAVTAALTVATIVFSEIVPKSLGTHYAPQISRVSAPFLRGLVIVIFPLAWLFERLTSAVAAGERRVGTEDQIRSLVRMGHSAGYIEPDETRMVHRVFLLNDRVAGELMTPMSHVVTLESGMSVHCAANRVADEPYTRFPVVDDDGEVLGMVISHDLLHGLVTDRRDRPIDSILRTPPVVDAGLRADELLEMLRRRKVHLALVCSGDDTVGVVSLEDVLEELVGEIVDEREADRSE